VLFFFAGSVRKTARKRGKEPMTKLISEQDEARLRQTKVYVASAWWRDCDAFASVVANSAKVCERKIMQAMRDAATDAFNHSEPEDERTVDDYMEDIAWSGVSLERLEDVMASWELDRYFAGVASDIDACDMDALLSGDKTAYVWLPLP
jgi:hypothetical protein